MGTSTAQILAKLEGSKDEKSQDSSSLLPPSEVLDEHKQPVLENTPNLGNTLRAILGPSFSKKHFPD